MFYQTEAKPQSWRAVAVFDDRPDQLLYLNRSATRVREGFRNVFFELLDEEERSHVRHVSLQRWQAPPTPAAGSIRTNWPSPRPCRPPRSFPCP